MTPEAARPRVDVVIPAYNEERHIARCLDAVLEQDYPEALVQVWLVDAGSTDATEAIAAERARGVPRLAVLREGKRLSTPEALNVGIASGSAELVARVDAHGYPAPDFLRRAVEAFEAGGPELACVGGRAEPQGETTFGRALALAWTSRFGVGGSVYASGADRELVDTVPWGMYRRSALERVGPFDPDMRYGEDEELNWRLRKAGFDVLLDTSVRFSYVPRGSWAAAFRQYRDYGEARTRVVARHPDFMRLHHLVPAAFVAGTAALALASPWAPLARRVLVGSTGAYLSSSVAAAAVACRGRDRRLLPAVAAAFWALHMGYGTGMLRGVPAWVAQRRRRGGREISPPPPGELAGS